MLAGMLTRKMARAGLVLLAVTFIGFGANALAERKVVDDPTRQIPRYDAVSPEEVGTTVHHVVRYIGLSEDVAVRALRRDDARFQIVWRDGVGPKRQPGDRRNDRVYLYIRDGVVVDARKF